MKTPGLNIILKGAVEGAAFPKFDSDFIVSYDAYWSTYRLFVRDGLRQDLPELVQKCEKSGYHVVNFSFAVWEEGIAHVEFVAAEIGYQRIGFFENADDQNW